MDVHGVFSLVAGGDAAFVGGARTLGARTPIARARPRAATTGVVSARCVPTASQERRPAFIRSSLYRPTTWCPSTNGIGAAERTTALASALRGSTA